MSILLLAAASLMASAPSPLSPLGSLIQASDYPAGAMQRGETGYVRFRLRIDTTGKPDGCVVLQTSGSTDLDNATCDLMLARAHFHPALGPSGQPERGDYSARIAWTMEDQPEAVISEAVRVRSELDNGGTVVSCTAAPEAFAASMGGCGVFGDRRMLGHLVRGPLTGFAWIEMRIIKQASTDVPLADPVPAGALKSVVARSTVTITPAGTISGCTNDVVTSFDGRPLNLCAIGQAYPAAKFAPTTTSAVRHLTIIMETVSQAR